MTSAMNVLDGGIVGVFMAHEESRLHIATIWVLTLAVEDIGVKLNVVIVDRIIESDCDHLWHIFGWQVSGNGGSIF